MQSLENCVLRKPGLRGCFPRTMAQILTSCVGLRTLKHSLAGIGILKRRSFKAALQRLWSIRGLFSIFAIRIVEGGGGVLI